ncbi:MAG TPA: MmgE/PrpD family protein [Dehalococcoidia bacterium]|nr:MmgE/PrpD family protein [Dehalococcoidia bacterium]
MSDDVKSSPIEALSANVLATRFENFDQATLDGAKGRITEVLGCAVGGARAVGNPGLLDLVKGWGGKEEATILVYGTMVPVHNAAMVNSIMARSFDFEPVAPWVDDGDIPAHISGTTVMTAVSLGEMTDINGRELITALLVGDDIAVRVLAAHNFNFTLGWDNTGTVNMVGATAIAGRLLGLNERQMRHAFGIVLSQMAGSMQNVWDGSTAFKLPQGLSARNGIFSAQLAKAGWTGPEDMLLSRYGFYHLYADGCKNPDLLTRDLGKKYYSDSMLKPYPSCRATHPAVDCALALINKYDIKAEDIEEVVLYEPRPGLEGFCGQTFRIGEFPHGNAAFNYRYNVANALLRRSVKPEHFSEAAIHDPEIKALVGRIVLAEMPGGNTLSAELKVKMKDGRDFSEFTDTPKGNPQNPMTKDEIKDKFRANMEYSGAISRDNAEKALELLENLEGLDSVRSIVKLLVG